MFGVPVLYNSGDGGYKTGSREESRNVCRGQIAEGASAGVRSQREPLFGFILRVRKGVQRVLSFPLLCVNLPNHYLISNESSGGQRASLCWHTLRGTLQYFLRH